MNVQEHLLIIVMEECNELAQRCSKALRFGLHEVQPGQQYNNAERIQEEYADLIGAIRMLSETMDFSLDSLSEVAINEKKLKIKKFMEYARCACGTLVD